jgi:hypothetical protein
MPMTALCMVVFLSWLFVMWVEDRSAARGERLENSDKRRGRWHRLMLRLRSSERGGTMIRL